MSRDQTLQHAHSHAGPGPEEAALQPGHLQHAHGGESHQVSVPQTVCYLSTVCTLIVRFKSMSRAKGKLVQLLNSDRFNSNGKVCFLGINEAFSLFMLILEKGIWKGNTTIYNILST